MEKDRSYVKKQLAAYVRGGDFSHPGETEAIDEVMKNLGTFKFNSLLDVGSGLGGTAKYLQDHGYGIPIGIDLNKNNIEYATNKYPDIKFHHCNVLDSFKLLNPKKFDLICLFSSFLLFEHQQDSLITLSNLAHKDSKLILFDYTLLQNSNFVFMSNKYNPIDLDKINDMLFKAGWAPEQYIDMSANFLRWYTEFSNNIKNKKNELINLFGIEAYNNFFTTYNNYMELYKINALGGCTIIAKKL